MTSPQILGPLSAIHQMLMQLVESLPEADADPKWVEYAIPAGNIFRAVASG